MSAPAQSGAPHYVAFERAIAGNPLYFTGMANYTLVNTPYLEGAQLFSTAAEAAAAVAPWNRLGRTFLVAQA